jgi:hypothetical protein
MVALRSCEILDELKKLGVETLSEQLEFLKEYAVYCYFVSREEE